MRGALLTLLICLAPLCRGQMAEDSLLSAVSSLYNQGTYEAAELAARRALSADGTLSLKTRTEFEKLLAFTLVAEGQNQEARGHFLIALSLSPDLALDPVLVSPKIIAVFEEAKQQFKADLAKKETAVSAAGHAASWRILVYPGWDQYRQGHETKGVALAALETAFLGATVALELSKESAREKYLSATEAADISSTYQTYDNLRKAEFYTAAGAVVVWLYSQLDAFLHLPPSLDALQVIATPNGTSRVEFRVHF